jgi:hypothetical protein
MGKQINFIMSKEKENNLKEFLEENNIELYFITNNEAVKIINFPEPYSIKGWFNIYLYKSEFGDLILKKTKNEIVYIDAIESPVIEYSRTGILEKEKIISRGRFWYEPKFYSSVKKLIEKPKGLDDTFKQLSNWIKKNLNKTNITTGKGVVYKEFVSEDMKNLIESKGYNFQS